VQLQQAESTKAANVSCLISLTTCVASERTGAHNVGNFGAHQNCTKHMCKLRADLEFICDMHASCSLQSLRTAGGLGPVWQSARV